MECIFRKRFFYRMLVLALAYVIIGVLFMKFAKKEEGVNIFPNVNFWKRLPFLIKVRQQASTNVDN